MKAITIKDANVLVPNKEHKNFTDSGIVIPSGTQLNGEEVQIKGMRRGEDFTYKLFLTKDNQLIYLNKIKPMPVTEVLLGANGSQSGVEVNLIPAETFSTVKLVSVLVGAGAGYYYAKYKKHDMNKTLMYAGIGAVLGYGAGYIVDTNKKIIVTPSK